MNTIERQVSEALHEQDDELSISSKDLSQLQRELHRRARGVHRPYLSGKEWMAGLAAACAVLLVGLVGFALRDDAEPKPITQPSVTISDFVGLWSVELDHGIQWLWAVSPDGKLSFITVPEQLLPGHLPAFTVLLKVGSDRAVTTEPDRSDCTRWQLVPVVEGRLLATPYRTQDGCGWNNGDELDLTRITPRPDSMEPWRSIHPSTGMTPVTRMLQLHGIWLMPSTGEVLAIGGRAISPANYAIYGPGADSPHETGTVWVQRGGGVVFVSDTVDTRCTTAYDGFSTDTATLAGRVAPTTCTRIGGPDSVWVRL
jgi:hypothetical protein